MFEEIAFFNCSLDTEYLKCIEDWKNEQCKDGIDDKYQRYIETENTKLTSVSMFNYLS